MCSGYPSNEAVEPSPDTKHCLQDQLQTTNVHVQAIPDMMLHEGQF